MKLLIPAWDTWHFIYVSLITECCNECPFCESHKSTCYSLCNIIIMGQEQNDHHPGNGTIKFIFHKGTFYILIQISLNIIRWIHANNGLLPILWESTRWSTDDLIYQDIYVIRHQQVNINFWTASLMDILRFRKIQKKQKFILLSFFQTVLPSNEACNLFQNKIQFCNIACVKFFETIMMICILHYHIDGDYEFFLRVILN